LVAGDKRIGNRLLVAILVGAEPAEPHQEIEDPTANLDRVHSGTTLLPGSPG
jgi:hypothetical protein